MLANIFAIVCGHFRMMFLLDMLMRASANQGHDWTMNMEVVLLNTGMAIVIGLLP